jgi:hypothetical protein
MSRKKNVAVKLTLQSVDMLDAAMLSVVAPKKCAGNNWLGCEEEEE